MGKVRVKKYGEAILKVIKAFCEENDIEFEYTPIVFESEKKKTKKVDTKLEPQIFLKQVKLLTKLLMSVN